MTGFHQSGEKLNLVMSQRNLAKVIVARTPSSVVLVSSQTCPRTGHPCHTRQPQIDQPLRNPGHLLFRHADRSGQMASDRFKSRVIADDVARFDSIDKFRNPIQKIRQVGIRE